MIVGAIGHHNFTRPRSLFNENIVNILRKRYLLQLIIFSTLAHTFFHLTLKETPLNNHNAWLQWVVTSTWLCCLQLLSYAPPSSSNIYRNLGNKLIDSLHGEGGRKGNLWHSPPASMTSRLASVTFKMASKVFIEETDFRFLGFGDFKVSIVIEN